MSSEKPISVLWQELAITPARLVLEMIIKATNEK
jgi:hypothetical protein